MTEAPNPMTPLECDLHDYPWMPLDVTRLFASETWVLGSAEEKVAALSLWARSWHQVPAGSLPDNDRMLSHLSDAGARWSKVKVHAMRGWVKCSDGRLYHPVVCEKANESWQSKLAQRARTDAARKAKADRKHSVTADPQTPKTPPVTEHLTMSVTEPVTEPVTDIVTSSTGKERKGDKKERKSSELRSGDEPPPLPDARAELWQVGLGLLGRMTGKPPKACRTLLGQLLRPMRDDCAGLLAVLREAEEARPVEPVAWLQGAVRHRTHAKPGAMDIIRADWNLPDLLWHTPKTDDEPMGLLQ